MSNEQDLRNQNLSGIESEPKVSDELTGEELDQVVGGANPKGSKGTSKPQPVQYLQVTMEQVFITSAP